MGFWDGFSPTENKSAPAPKSQPKQSQGGFWSGFKPTAKPGDKIGGMRIVAAQSTTPIHYGTHVNPGVYDITEQEAVAKYGSMANAARVLKEQGFAVAVREKGQRNIESNHIHFADPEVNPTEAKRLRGQKSAPVSKGATPTAKPAKPTVANAVNPSWNMTAGAKPVRLSVTTPSGAPPVAAKPVAKKPAPKVTPIIDLMRQDMPAVLSAGEVAAQEKAIQDRSARLTYIVNTKVFPDGKYNEGALKQLVTNLGSDWEKEYVRRAVEANVRQYQTEPSTREYLAGFLLGAWSPAGSVAKAGEALASKGGLVGKAGQALVKGAKAVDVAAKAPGIKGAATTTALRAGRGAVENLAFEAVADPSRLPDTALQASAFGAGAGAILGAFGGRPVTPVEAARVAEVQNRLAPFDPRAQAGADLMAQEAALRGQAGETLKGMGLRSRRPTLNGATVVTDGASFADLQADAAGRLKAMGVSKKAQGIDTSAQPVDGITPNVVAPPETTQLTPPSAQLGAREPSVLGGVTRQGNAYVASDGSVFRGPNSKGRAEAHQADINGTTIKVKGAKSAPTKPIKVEPQKPLTIMERIEAATSADEQWKIANDRIQEIHRTFDPESPDAAAVMQEHDNLAIIRDALDQDLEAYHAAHGPNLPDATPQVGIGGRIKSLFGTPTKPRVGESPINPKTGRPVDGPLPTYDIQAIREGLLSIADEPWGFGVPPTEGFPEWVSDILRGQKDVNYFDKRTSGTRTFGEVISDQLNSSEVARLQEIIRTRYEDAIQKPSGAPPRRLADFSLSQAEKPTPAKPQYEKMEAKIPANQSVIPGMSFADTFDLTSEKAPNKPYVKPQPTPKQAGQTGMFDTPTPAARINAAVPEANAPGGASAADSKYAGSVNLDKWNTTEDIKQWARDTYEANKTAIDEQRRGVRMHEATQNAADALAMTADTAGKIKKGTALNAEQNLALAQETIAAAEKVKAASKKVQAIRDGAQQGNLEIAEAELLKAQADADLLFKVLNGSATEAGRALEIHKKIRKAYEHVISKPIDVFEMTGEAPPAIEVQLPRNFGQRNRVFTRAKYDAATARLQAKMGRMNMGVPVDMIPDLVEIGGYYVEGAFKEFAEWAPRFAREMKNRHKLDLSEADLKTVWEGIRAESAKRAEELGNRPGAKTLKSQALRRLEKYVGGKENITSQMLDDLSQIADDDMAGLVKYLAKRHNVTLGQAALDVLNFSRTTLTAGDLSATFRQGAVLGAGHPKSFIRAMKVYGTVLKSDAGFYKLMESIRANPKYERLENAGVYLGEIDGGLSAAEEAFMSKFAQKIPGVRLSARAYTGFLNALRSDVFYSYADALGDAMTPAQDSALGDVINAASGRGRLGPLETSGHALSTALFSPRFFVSRIQALTDPFTKTGPARTAAIKNLIGFSTAVGTTLWMMKQMGAQVETDPHSSDFGKARWGKFRLDLTAGYAPIVRYAWQFVTNQRKNTETGRISTLNRGETLARFGRSKLSPSFGLGNDLITGKTYTGEGTLERFQSPGKLAFESFAPMNVQDFWDGLTKQGLLTGIAAGAASTIGFGAQTYEATPIQRFWNAGDAKVPKALMGLWSQYKELSPRDQKAFVHRWPELRPYAKIEERERGKMRRADPALDVELVTKYGYSPVTPEGREALKKMYRKKGWRPTR